jgi:hypothetical protein
MPIYVGFTKRPMRDRLRSGWTAKGETGYYGYPWRHRLTEANLDVWCHEDAPDDKASADIETVEAEVVFLVRCAGQWPFFINPPLPTETLRLQSCSDTRRKRQQPADSLDARRCHCFVNEE